MGKRRYRHASRSAHPEDRASGQGREAQSGLLSRSSTRTMIASLTAWASVSNSKQPCHVGYEQRVLLRSCLSSIVARRGTKFLGTRLAAASDARVGGSRERSALVENSLFSAKNGSDAHRVRHFEPHRATMLSRSNVDSAVSRMVSRGHLDAHA